MNNYLSVCMFQIKCICDCDSENEYLIETKEVLEELERAFEIISLYRPDIAMFPEMTYLEKYEKRYMEAIPLLREMLIKHPGNEKLMYNLAWALSGTIRESKENYEEAILLYHKILEISTDTEMRNKVSRDLMYRYYTLGNIEKALYYANTLPSFELCREYHLGRGNLFEGKELSKYLQDNIQLYGKAMLECLEYFECPNILTEEEKKPYNTEIAKRKIELLKEILK